MSADRKTKAARRRAEREERKAGRRTGEAAAALVQTADPSIVEQASAKLREDADRTLAAPATISSAPPVPKVAGLHTDTGDRRIINNPARPFTAPQMANPVQAAAENRLTSGAVQPSFSSMLSGRLAEMRKSAEQEKTDAAKMQKYYALADVLKSIGQLGGTTAGGAIGGNMADSAPAVAPYKESRGYLDAFERAKKASDRIRELDEKGFSLLLRDDERAYNKAMADEERKYKEAVTAKQREWEKTFYDYQAKIKAANDAANTQLAHELKLELMAKEQEHKKEMAGIQHNYNMAQKRLSKEIVDLQMGGASGFGKSKPFRFADGTTTYIPEYFYDDMISSYIGTEIGGEYAKDKQAVITLLKKNPQYVRDYMKSFGYDMSGTGQPGGSAGELFFPFVELMPEDMRRTAYGGGASSGSAENDPFAEFLVK